MATSALGALAIVGAAFNGISFLNYGHDFSSMIMAGLWALALACYITGIYLAARRLVRGSELTDIDILFDCIRIGPTAGPHWDTARWHVEGIVMAASHWAGR